jgi:RNA polymerase sigma factor (sigma-70 family)
MFRRHNVEAQPGWEAANLIPDDLSVTVLVERARDGDQRAWKQIVERYTPLVLSICEHYPLTRSDMDDVCQMVWALLVEQLGNLRVAASLPGWLTTTTRRECNRILRAARRYDLTGLPDDNQMEPGQDDAVMEEILAAERITALRAAFNDLPLLCRQLLSMMLSDPPLPYAQVSATLPIAMGSISPQRARCLERLRRSPHLAALTATDDKLLASLRHALPVQLAQEDVRQDRD